MKNNEKKEWVLVNDKSGFFREQNLYLGSGICAMDLKDAKILTLEEAVSMLKRTAKPNEWHIRLYNKDEVNKELDNKIKLLKDQIEEL